MDLKLSKDEETLLKKAFKSENLGITNNQTFNDSSHNNGGNLEPSGSSEVWAPEEKEDDDEEPKIEKAEHRLRPIL